MADYSPSKVYYDEAKKLGLDKDRLLPTDRILAYLQAQIEEIKAITNRDLIDVVGLVKNRDESKDEVSIQAYSEGISKHVSQIRQYVNKLDALIQFQKELEAEE